MKTLNTLIFGICVVPFYLLLLGCNINPKNGARIEPPKLHDRFTIAIYNSNNTLISDPIGDLENHTTYHNLLSFCQLSNDKNFIEVLKKNGKSSLIKKACIERESLQHQITDIYVISHGWNYTTEESIDLYNDYIDKLEIKKFNCHDNQIVRKDVICEPFHPFYIFVSWPSTIRPISQTLNAILPYSLGNSSSPLGSFTKIIDSVVFHLPTVWQQSLNTYEISKVSKSLVTNDDYKDLYSNFQKSNQIVQSVDKVKIPFSIVLYELIKYKERQISGVKPKIHLIGHSFGAKLLTLSAFDAIFLWNKENNRSINENPIESLLLFNATFEPWELLDITALKMYDQKDHELEGRFESISKKAIVYSNTDFAAGIAFDASQVIMSNALTAVYSDMLNLLKDIIDEANMNKGYKKPLYIASDSIYSFAYLGMTLALSPIEWVGRKVVNLPFDYIYHINNNNTFFDPSESFLHKGFNAFHYFLPLDKLFSITDRHADKMGLFRSSTEALGRTGLYRREVGMPKLSDSNWLKILSDNNWLNKYNSNNSELSAEDFCKYSLLSMEQSWPVLKKQIFYSYDGSKVLSSIIPGVGAHGDISVDNDQTKCDKNEFSKQESIFNFTYNFTKKFKTEN